MTYETLHKESEKILKDYEKNYDGFNKLRTDFSKNLLNNTVVVYSLYKLVSHLTYSELEKLFPCPKTRIAQNVFDYTNYLFIETSEKDSDKDIKNFSKVLGEIMQDDKHIKFIFNQQLLQGIFFFLIFDLVHKNLSTKNELQSLFEEFLLAIDNKNWNKPDTQRELLNKLSQILNFADKEPFGKISFEGFQGYRFSANESILRLIYNFTRPALVIKEAVVNELNFIRTQQTEILPCIVNTKKRDFTEGDANDNIRKCAQNLSRIKQMDKGFNIPDFTQNFMMNNEKLNHTIVRPLFCKCFKETNTVWDKQPVFENGKISAAVKQRSFNEDSLKGKFLYPERNVFTHSGEHYAIYYLFSKEYGENEIERWERLVLSSMYDIRKFLKSNKLDEYNTNCFLNILDFYFKKIVSKAKLSAKNTDELWNKVFNSHGEIQLSSRDKLDSTNINDRLNETERNHFKKFVSFMYCAENLQEDFITKNLLQIQIYLTYITIALSKADKEN